LEKGSTRTVPLLLSGSEGSARTVPLLRHNMRASGKNMLGVFLCWMGLGAGL
jgi:hypothetical protein